MSPSLTATTWRPGCQRIAADFRFRPITYLGANTLVNNTPVSMSTLAGATGDLAYGDKRNAILYIVVTNDDESLDAQPVDCRL